jgi:hypothetical protein
MSSDFYAEATAASLLLPIPSSYSRIASSRKLPAKEISPYVTEN